MTPTVFAVQNQMTRSADGSGLVPKYDLTPAETHGTLLFLLGPSASPFSPTVVLPEMRAKLQHYDYRKGDSLLLVGNPALIGWAVALAAQAGDGRVRVLQWSGTQRGYTPIEADVWLEQEELHG